MSATIFISYSHDSDEHSQWVKDFTDRLLGNGLPVILDQYDLKLGDDLQLFMENSVSGAKYILAICTDTYNKKADGRLGGVGYETTILTPQLMAKDRDVRVIPIVRDVSEGNETPRFLASLKRTHFRKYDNFDAKLKELTDQLLADLDLLGSADPTAIQNRVESFKRHCSLDLQQAFIILPPAYDPTTNVLSFAYSQYLPMHTTGNDNLRGVALSAQERLVPEKENMLRIAREYIHPGVRLVIHNMHRGLVQPFVAHGDEFYDLPIVNRESEVRIGQRVEHPELGQGTVYQDGSYIAIRFDFFSVGLYVNGYLGKLRAYPTK